MVKERYVKQRLAVWNQRIRQKAMFSGFLRSLFEAATAHLKSVTANQMSKMSYGDIAFIFHTLFNSEYKEEFCHRVASQGLLAYLFSLYQ